MSKVVPISRDDELLEAASRWVLKIDARSPLSAGEETGLAAWLDEHRRHRELLQSKSADVWDKTDALARLAELFPHDSATSIGCRTAPGSGDWFTGSRCLPRGW